MLDFRLHLMLLGTNMAALESDDLYMSYKFLSDLKTV